MSEIIFDAEVKSQFLMKGDIVERKGHVIELLTQPRASEPAQTVYCWGRDLDSDMTFGFTLAFDLFVQIGTEV